MGPLDEARDFARRIAGMGEQNSCAVRESAAAARDLAALAAELQQAVGRFRM